MAINALEGLAAEWFTPAGQDQDSAPAEFELRPLDGEQFTTLFLMMDRGRNFTGEAVSYALRCGLTGQAKGFIGERGELPATPGNHALMPFALRLELANRIFEISIMSQAEKKT